ncbi:hypothetical protein GBA63_08845 [Rubrobacter tropicus]|uniref:Uncharacterized protein n=1 Tax=Rubrobacter tropicus TaxID=2653851 RepID=A0A6G8Q8E5_9ACTN|nr:hypothetical protein [Rubrobacter tropicus]QIN82741.1 hypothetical protein GBA63_08845 [Rubrobacter tropicus]
MSEATKQEQTMERQRRFERARKSVRDMEEAVEPYTERHEIRESSEPSQWRDASDYERSHFFRDLKKVVRKLPSNHPSRSGSGGR